MSPLLITLLVLSIVFITFIILILILCKFWISITNLQNSIVSPNNKLNDYTLPQQATILTINCYLSFWLANSPQQRLITLTNTHLINYDIVCMQEAFGVCTIYAKELIETMKSHGFQWYCIPQNPSGFKIVDSGLIVFSKIPIVNYQFVPFNEPGEGADKLAEKGFQIINLSNNTTIINTHTQANVSPNSLQIQLNQIKQLASHIANHNNTIICGDFNIDFYDTQKYTQMINILNLPKSHDILYDNKQATTHNNERLDYIFYNPSLCTNTQVVDMKDISDHNGIY